MRDEQAAVQQAREMIRANDPDTQLFREMFGKLSHKMYEVNFRQAPTKNDIANALRANGRASGDQAEELATAFKSVWRMLGAANADGQFAQRDAFFVIMDAACNPAFYGESWEQALKASRYTLLATQQNQQRQQQQQQQQQNDDDSSALPQINNQQGVVIGNAVVNHVAAARRD